jgi:hypothetical protein
VTIGLVVLTAWVEFGVLLLILAAFLHRKAKP